MAEQQPLIGFRAWRLQDDEGLEGPAKDLDRLKQWVRPERGVHLYPMTEHSEWNLEGPTRSRCAHRNHQTPSPRCGCGLHGFDRLENVRHYYQGGLEVEGAIKAWGQGTLLFEDQSGNGFRAAFARPVAFLLPRRERHQVLVREAAGRLGVPVVLDRRRLRQVAMEFGQSVSEALGEGPLTPPEPQGPRRLWLQKDLDERTEEMAEWGGDYRPVRPEPAGFEQANLVSSLSEDGWHRGVLDVDKHAPPIALMTLRRAWEEVIGRELGLAQVRVRSSSTPGHSHLYVAAPLRWSEYRALLQDLQVRGLLEHGYVDASLRAGMSFVRKPGVLKPGVRPFPSVAGGHDWPPKF